VAGADVAVVAVEGTSGWTAAAAELAGALRRAGASVVLAGTGSVPLVRTFALTDLVQARAARQAAERAIAEHDPAAVVYCSITAALLWPRPGAVWVDSVAAENRPGRHGVWQRVVERRRLVEAPLVLAMSPRALQARPELRDEAVVVPVPVSGSGPPAPARDVAAVTYGANPQKRRLDLVLAAWSRAKRPGEKLVVAGLERYAPIPAGVELAGRLGPDEYRALLRRARVFVTAPRREEYGIAALEALADGCILVTTPAEGAYPALEVARRLDPRLVTDDLVGALRLALDDPVPAYSARAAELLEPYSREALDRTLAQDVLPRLLA
jgi:glycosyltransferase involved in cell wall biosynthesis